MQAYIGMGSNLKDRHALLCAAAQRLQLLSSAAIRCSPIYQSPAMLPKEYLPGWSRPFLNLVVEIQTDLSAEQLLIEVQSIEKDLGRIRDQRWQPREIDLDILTYANEVITSKKLTIPHPAINLRNFVLEPLKDLNSSYLKASRELHTHLPLWMDITNLTPDSFSDGGENNNTVHFEKRLQELSDAGIQIIDLGAESTRPNAKVIDPAEEWSRLHPFIEVFKHHYKNSSLGPRLSIDSRNISTIEKCVEAGIDYINDVSGDISAFGTLLHNSDCEYIMMHNLGVPANPSVTCSVDQDIISQLKHWLNSKLELANTLGIGTDRIIFDPGIGFGKTADQSLEIINRIEEFHEFPVKILVGHSRKSFMKTFAHEHANARDPESMGLSVKLAQKGVNIIRVHSADLHARCFLSYSHGQMEVQAE